MRQHRGKVRGYGARRRGAEPSGVLAHPFLPERRVEHLLAQADRAGGDLDQFVFGNVRERAIEPAVAAVADLLG